MHPAVAFLQKGSAGIGGIAPVLLPDVPLALVAAAAALNPATIAVAIVMGRSLGQRRDQKAKLMIAAFAAAIAGAALLWLGTKLGISALATPARAAGGIFVASFFFAFLYSAIAYKASLPK